MRGPLSGEFMGTMVLVQLGVSLNQGVSVRNVDFHSLRRQLIAQKVPLPDAYPAQYKKDTKESVAVYEPPMFGERVMQK